MGKTLSKEFGNMENKIGGGLFSHGKRKKD
jgi:hypothetical protein